MSCNRHDRVARYFAEVDTELAKLIGRLRGEQLVAATRARATIGELVRACGDHPALLRLVRALQSAPGKPRGRPFAHELTDDEVDRALRENGWKVSVAAAVLGCEPSTLYRRRGKLRAIACTELRPDLPRVSTGRR